MPGGYPLLDDHLDRLKATARYFDYPVDEARVRRELAAVAAAAPEGTHKVRLLVDRGGPVTVEAEAILHRQAPARVTLALAAVDSSDPFLYHKTTNRTVHEAALSAHPGFDDVILMNERGELTEATRANLVLEVDGSLVTPPVSSGLLPGVLRGRLIDEGRLTERLLTVEDLNGAARIHLINAVRGWREATLVQ